MNKKLIILGAIGCALGGAAVERAYQGHGSVAINQKETDITKNNIITKTHEEDRPDGSKIIDSTTTDNSEIIKKMVEQVRIDDANKMPNWQVAIGSTIGSNQIYSISIDRRLLGPLTLGAGYSLNGLWQARVGIQF